MWNNEWISVWYLFLGQIRRQTRQTEEEKANLAEAVALLGLLLAVSGSYEEYEYDYDEE